MDDDVATERPRTLDEIVAEQECVIAYRQARDLGLTDEYLEWKVNSGRWQRPLPRALVTHSGELTFRQQLWVGWAYTYPDGVISCHSAAAVDDLKGFGSATVHITVPQGKKPSPQPGLRLHESRHLGGNDVHPIKRPTRMRIERSLVGIAAHAKRVDGAIAALAAGVQQQLTTAPLLAETLRRLPTTKWRGELLAVCADLAGGSHSVIEVEAMRVFRKYRLPLPDRQVPMTLPDGLARVDCYWSSRGVVAELDGRMHMDVAQWVADLDRQNELSLESNLVLRYPLWALRFRPEHVAGNSGALSATNPPRSWNYPSPHPGNSMIFGVRRAGRPGAGRRGRRASGGEGGLECLRELLRGDRA